MPFSPEEISSKHFVVTLRGYDRAEVDAYLRALASDQARMLRRISELESSPDRREDPGASGDGDMARLLDDALRAITELRRHLPDVGATKAAGTARTTRATKAAATKATKSAATKAAATKAELAKTAATKAATVAASSSTGAASEVAATPTSKRAASRSSGRATASAASAASAAEVGPYADEPKFLEEQRELLETERAVYLGQATDLRAEADALAQEREPGDVQFDEESGEGGTVTVDRERDLALSAQALAAVEEIDAALTKIDRRTYGACERCHQPIPKARLRALPYARLCVACKSGGLSSRR